MMMPPYTYVAARLAEERTNDRMRQEGELAHLLRHARPARRGPTERLVVRFGGLLASLGRSLQKRDALTWAEPGSPIRTTLAHQHR